MTTAVLVGAMGAGKSTVGQLVAEATGVGFRDTDDDIEAVVVVPVDMPGLTTAAVRRVTALPYPDVLVCATYDGLRGYPMLFGRRHWSGIATLASADVGARPTEPRRPARPPGRGRTVAGARAAGRRGERVPRGRGRPGQALAGP